MTAATRTEAAAPRNVLVVEDNLVSQQVAVGLLEQRGFTVDVAHNGNDALDKIGAGRYAAIFLYCQLPDLNGFEIASRLRSREGTSRHTPIVALTANALQGDRKRCLAAGMDHYLEKPIRAQALDDVVAAIFDHQTTRAATAERPPAQPSQHDLLHSGATDRWATAGTGRRSRPARAPER